MGFHPNVFKREFTLQNLYPYHMSKMRMAFYLICLLKTSQKHKYLNLFYFVIQIWFFLFGWFVVNKLFSLHSYDVYNNGLNPLLLIGKSHSMNDWLYANEQMCQSKHFCYALWRTISILISNFNTMWHLNTQIIELQWNFRMKYVIYKSNANWHIVDIVLKSKTVPNSRKKVNNTQAKYTMFIRCWQKWKSRQDVSSHGRAWRHNIHDDNKGSCFRFISCLHL